MMELVLVQSDELKIARIIPIYKIGDKKDFGN